MAIEVFSRVEKKFIISQKDVDILKELLKNYMNLDLYNKDEKPYSIYNIYFDTPSNELIINSLEKPIYKEKLRLRSYGPSKLDGIVYFEIKKKFKEIVYKRRTPIILMEAYEFIKNGKMPEKSQLNVQVFNEVKELMNRYDLKPKVFLSYDRFAYFGKDDESFRITLDKNIQTRRTDLQLEETKEAKKLLDDDKWLMEAKGNYSFPLWFVHFLSERKIQSNSFSKYGKEFELYKNEKNC